YLRQQPGSDVQHGGILIVRGIQQCTAVGGNAHADQGSKRIWRHQCDSYSNCTGRIERVPDPAYKWQLGVGRCQAGPADLRQLDLPAKPVAEATASVWRPNSCQPVGCLASAKSATDSWRRAATGGGAAKPFLRGHNRCPMVGWVRRSPPAAIG